MVNGHTVPLTQVGHRAYVGKAEKVNAMLKEAAMEHQTVKLNGAKCIEIDMDGFKIMLDKPIPNRPNVVRVTTSDGQRSILGDYGTYTEQDARALQSAVDKERTYWRHSLDKKENKALADAERDLKAALRMVDLSGSKLEQARLALRRFTQQHDGNLDAHSRDIHRLERMIEQANSEWLESRQSEGHARAALNNLEQHLGRMARVRMPLEATGSIVRPKDVTATNWRERLRRGTQ